MSMVYLYIYFSSSVSFIDSLSFSVYGSFTTLDKFIPRYFILSDVIANGILCLISFSDRSLLVYRNTTDFYVLVLYPAILLDLFISSEVWGGVVRVFYLQGYIICRQCSFTSFLDHLLWRGLPVL